jgi:hypothetical protein
VRDDVGVSERGDDDTGTPSGDGSGEVLANLPRTRPQRPSARRQAMRGTSPQAAETSSGTPAKRAAAKRPAAKASAAKARAAKGSAAKGSAAKGAARRTATPAGRGHGSGASRGRASTPRAASEARAPAQGFESVTGSVRPPTGAEVVGSAVEAAGDIAQAGVRAGGRLLRGALSLLPRP